MTKKLRTEPTAPISGEAIATAQAVDTLIGAFDDDGHPYTVDSATAHVLKAREDAKLPLPTPTPQELVEALDYLKRQREGDTHA
jgi:hypothetical protein